MNLFLQQQEQEAISRIQRFARLAETMQFDVCLGFSGGKDSQVVYDLCKRSGIPFTAYFNHAFESAVTLRFISEHYTDVVWRRDYRYGFISNIRKHAILPSVQQSYCCDNYKHNPHYVDKCSIIGVRREESNARRSRTTIMVKNKSTMKKNKDLLNDYFKENCQSVGSKSVIQLMPIIDWRSADVWQYIREHGLPVNPEYTDKVRRVGCIVCPKANFNSNYYGLSRYPGLIDAFILALEHPYNTPPHKSWDYIITSDGRCYADDKPYYICRWLNHSFMPFTRRQQALYEKFRQEYDEWRRRKTSYYLLKG